MELSDDVKEFFKLSVVPLALVAGLVAYDHFHKPEEVDILKNEMVYQKDFNQEQLRRLRELYFLPRFAPYIISEPDTVEYKLI